MIEVIALDVYGTILASDDSDNELPPRKGIEEFLDACHMRSIKVASCSDSNIVNVKIDLSACGVLINKFNYFFQLNQLPYKDFNIVLEHYKIDSRKLLVIGDSDKDINGAIKCDSLYVRVPEYFKGRDSFDFVKIFSERFFID